MRAGASDRDRPRVPALAASGLTRGGLAVHVPSDAALRSEDVGERRRRRRGGSRRGRSASVACSSGIGASGLDAALEAGARSRVGRVGRSSVLRPAQATLAARAKRSPRSRSAEEARARRVGRHVRDAVVASRSCANRAATFVAGEVATMALVPAVVDAAARCPVLAAGGIADARGDCGRVRARRRRRLGSGPRFAPGRGNADAIRRYRELRLERRGHRHPLFERVRRWLAGARRIARFATARSKHGERAGSAATGSRPGEGEVVARRPDAKGASSLRLGAAARRDAKAEIASALAVAPGQSVGIVRDVRPAAEIVAELAAGRR